MTKESEEKPMTLVNEQGNYLLGAGIRLATRENTCIPNERRRQKPPVAMKAAMKLALDGHSSVVMRSLSSVYNCMGMVFASRRTWIDPEHLGMILKDDKYRRLTNDTEIEQGDVVVYRDDNETVSHVGIVVKVTTRLNEASIEVSVLSQWGADGEYFHLADDVNPALGSPAEYWTDRT